MAIDKGPETIIDLAAVFYLIMNVTSSNKETQSVVFNHIISTLNPPINNNATLQEIPSELGSCDSYFGLEEYFDDEEDEDESDSNSSNKPQSTQNNDSINQEDIMLDEGRVNSDSLPPNNQRNEEFLPEYVVVEQSNTPMSNNFINRLEYDSYSSAISQITEIINTQNFSHFDQLSNPFSNVCSYFGNNFSVSQFNSNSLSQFSQPIFSQIPTNYTETSSRVPVDQIIEKEIEKVIINGFSCSHCNNPASVYFSGKYSGIDSHDCFSKYSRNRCRMDLDCFEKLLKAQNHDLYLWFECLLKTREGRKKVFDILNNEDSERIKVLFKERKQTRNVDDVMYWKDNNLVSFKIVNNLRKECTLSDELPPTKDMKTRKKIIDEEVEKIFKIIAPSNGIVGFIADLHVSVEQILKLYRCLGGKQLPKTVYFKLCVDGREINGKKQIAIALVPLNLRDIFPTQAVSSVFYIGLFLGSETKSSLPETVGSLSDSLKFISSTTFENSNINFLKFKYLKMKNLLDTIYPNKTTVRSRRSNLLLDHSGHVYMVDICVSIQ
ncbi:predicted protein [Naegleria gruberi]|uniref:Predicted protein n=1 Tax=Naegleria gruberi TaxID=5762 RepID=D2V621_NAEGR|nr:uncharacterized protein NAEGRDRAFT_46960 [Naegleria gruberi]EFC47752.1 predicted protein [Naegleria gruberi]|eukprot:XP_002680496.1 predicted protein [Naegleria gruberi strain NEG-M]